LKFLKI